MLGGRGFEGRRSSLLAGRRVPAQRPRFGGLPGLEACLSPPAPRTGLARLLFGHFDHGPAHVVAAIGANPVRGHRGAALRAILQFERFDGVVGPAAIGAGVGMFAFRNSHGDPPNPRPALSGPSSMRITCCKNDKRTILSQPAAECQAWMRGGKCRKSAVGWTTVIYSGRVRGSHQRRSATTDQIASTTPKGHAPCRKP
jgi:hypothetical protein